MIYLDKKKTRNYTMNDVMQINTGFIIKLWNNISILSIYIYDQFVVDISINMLHAYLRQPFSEGWD